MTNTPYFGIKTRKLKQLRPVLHEYLKINRSTAELWDYEDLPWWYNERAQMSLLAGAIWKAKGFAFEEFAQQKTLIGNKYWGRSDLYFIYQGKEYVVESKVTHISLSRDLQIKRKSINEKLLHAVNDVKKNNGDPYAIKLAVLFIGVKYSRNKKKKVEHFSEFLKILDEINYSAVGWLYDHNAEEHPIWGKNTVFPGLVILLKRCK